MGWQDAPVVGGDQPQGWQNAPVVGDTSSGYSMLDYLHSASQGLQNVTRGLETNIPWEPLLNRAQGALDQYLGVGPTTQQLRQADVQGQQAFGQLPWYVRWPAQAGAYGAGMGAGVGATAAPGGGIANALGGGWLANATEGAAAGGLRGAGQSDSGTVTGNIESAAPSAILGAGAGLVGATAGKLANAVINKTAGALSRPASTDPLALVGQPPSTGALSTPVQVENAAKAARKVAYDALDAPGYNPRDANQALIDIPQGFWGRKATGADTDNIPMTNKVMEDLGDKVTNAPNGIVPASDITDAIRNLRSVRGKGITGLDNEAAGKFRAGLENFLATTPPTTFNTATNAMHTPADVAALRDAADQAQQTFKNAEMLGQWQRGVEQGQNPSMQAARYADKWYAPQLPARTPSPQYQALGNIANPPALPSAWNLSRAVHPILESVGAMAGAGLAGSPEVGALGGELAGGILGSAGKEAISAAMSRAQQAQYTRMIAQGYPALTGYRVANPPTDVSPFVRWLTLGGMPHR
jgi:hypothetical protein